MEGMFDTCLGFYVLASVVFVSIDKNLSRQKCWEPYPALLGFVLNTVDRKAYIERYGTKQTPTHAYGLGIKISIILIVMGLSISFT